MTAPARPPIFIDAIAGDEQIAPEVAVPWLIDRIVSAAKWFRDWTVEDLGVAVRLHATRQSTIEFKANSVRGVIELTADESGWLVAIVRIGGEVVFRGYIERPYEEYEIWPPHAGAAEGEAPGRIGKRATWISFAASPWPVLALIANSGGSVNISVNEAKLRQTMRNT